MAIVESWHNQDCLICLYKINEHYEIWWQHPYFTNNLFYQYKNKVYTDKHQAELVYRIIKNYWLGNNLEIVNNHSLKCPLDLLMKFFRGGLERSDTLSVIPGLEDSSIIKISCENKSIIGFCSYDLDKGETVLCSNSFKEILEEAKKNAKRPKTKTTNESEHISGGISENIPSEIPEDGHLYIG